MVNKVFLIGNLGQDPELRNTAGGNAVCTLRLATAERRKGADGNWAEHTEWHSVVTWGRDAENVAKYCRKGKQLFIEGRLQTRKYQDKDGRDKYSTEIVAENVRFLGGVLVLSGMFIMLWNMWKTSAMARDSSPIPVAIPAPAHA